MHPGDYLSFNVRIMKILTFYPLKKKLSSSLRLLYWMWKQLHSLTLVSIVLQTFIRLFQSRSAFSEDVAIALVNTLVILLGSVNLIYYRFRGDSLVKMISFIRKNFKYECEIGLDSENMEKYVRLTRIITTVWIINIMGTAVLMTTRTLLSPGERKLAVDAWFPYDWKKSPAFEISHIYLCFTHILLGFCFCLSDTFLFSIMYTTIGQFRILECNFRNLVYTSLLKYGYSKDDVVTFSKTAERTNSGWSKLDINIMTTIARNNEFNCIIDENMRQCIEHHNMLLSLCKQMESFFSPLLFIKIGSCVIFVIGITYSILMYKNASLRLALAGYLVGTLGEMTFLFCSGQLLLSENDNLVRGIYQCPWYLCGSKVRQGIYMIQMRCLYSNYLSAGKIMVVSWASYIIVLKNSASYFLMLLEILQ
ncbi:Odorant receptor Or109 [Rhyzopertha dominica]|nr:Odorant receptor Or109 [Rhyzopertha dominica]